jgi:hypothetical protein
MRIAVLFAILCLPLVTACQGFVQNVYDEQAKQECYDLPGIDAQQACLNGLERERIERRKASPDKRR